MLSNNNGDGGSNYSLKILNLIAKVLDCSTTEFCDPKSCDPKHTTELLKLWFTIKENQDRMKVLGFIRTISEKSSD